MASSPSYMCLVLITRSAGSPASLSPLSGGHLDAVSLSSPAADGVALDRCSADTDPPPPQPPAARALPSRRDKAAVGRGWGV